jgi:hypothetical protein
MKRSLIVLGIGALFAVAPAKAQTRVIVEVGVVAPPVYGHVVIGEPRVVYRPVYHRRYHRHYHRGYRRPAVVVVVPRQSYRYYSNGRYYYR